MEGISLEELQLAARNHGMPLEALRYPVTPVGLHYLLIHYDVPVVDAADWRLTVARRARALAVGWTTYGRARRSSMTATMECAGNGRARLDPRAGQPAVAARGGRHRALDAARRSRPLLDEAGVPEGTVEVLFTGLDRGVEGGEEQRFQRSLPLERGAGATTCCSPTR